MKITYQDISYIYKWLNVPLHGEELRNRNKFIGIIEPLKEEADNKRIEILESHSDKDADGKAIIEEGQYKIPEDKKGLVFDELAKFLDGETPLKVTDDNKAYFISARDILKKSTKDMDIEQGKVYDRILTEFETL